MLARDARGEIATAIGAYRLSHPVRLLTCPSAAMRPAFSSRQRDAPRRPAAALSRACTAVLAAALVSFPLATVRPQSTARTTGRGVILGRVVDATTGEPVADARVRLSGQDVWRLSDPEGRFAFFDLPAGDYGLWTEKDGYSPTRYRTQWSDANRTAILGLPDGQRFSLGVNEHRTDIVVSIWKHGALTGRVVDDLGDPLVGVLVQAWPRVFVAGRAWLNSAVPFYARTDDRGVYRMGELVAGDYVVAVPVVSAALPEAMVHVPAVESSAELLRTLRMFRPDAPRDTLLPTAGAMNGIDAAGVLQAPIGPPAPPPIDATGPQAGYATTFYPGVFSASEAASVPIAPHEEREIGDLRLQMRSTHRISGVVQGMSGPSPLVVRLYPGQEDTADTMLPTAITLTGVDGAFCVPSVPDGLYTLDVPALPSAKGVTGTRPIDAPDDAWLDRVWLAPDSPAFDQETRWARTQVVVADRDVTDVRLTLRAGARITGTIVFRGLGEPPAASAWTQIRVELDRPDGRPRTVLPSTEVAVDRSGSFRTLELAPGKYFLRMPAAPAGWTLDSAMVGGHDASISPIDLDRESLTGVVLALTDHPNTITGIVRKPDGSIDDTASVTLFPRDSAQWTGYGTWPRQIAAALVDANGRYTLTGMPPGEYWVAAVSGPVMAGWHDRDLFEAIARVAERLTIGAGDRRSLDLVTRRVLR